MLCILLDTIRCEFIIKVRGGYSTVNLVLHIGLVPVKLRFIAVYTLGDGVYFARIKHDGSRKIILDLKAPMVREYIALPYRTFSTWASVDSLMITGRVGVAADEPHTTALLVGLLKSLLDGLLATRTAFKSKHIYIIPDFANELFCLNMEGIVRIKTDKLIKEALRKFVNRKKKGQTK